MLAVPCKSKRQILTLVYTHHNSELLSVKAVVCLCLSDIVFLLEYIVEAVIRRIHQLGTGKFQAIFTIPGGS